MRKAGIHVIIQARMASSRLPGKILAPFVGVFNPLEWIIERARLSTYAERVIVATTTNPKDDKTEKICIKAGCDCVRGSEDDVLSRVAGAAAKFQSRIIADATGDNPFFDLAEMDRMIEIVEKEHLDYANNHPAGVPLGTGTQVFTGAAFARVAAEATDPYDHEHVTPYFYHHPELFKQREVAPLHIHPFAPHVRLTLDTPEDLALLQAVARGLGFSDPKQQPSTNEILSYLQSHPEIMAINQSIRQKTFPKP